jgi:transcription elongation factor Elf1
MLRIMRLLPITLSCPRCGSSDVVYSCHPGCCFNHVCGACLTTFELATSRLGEFAGDLGPLPASPDASEPTAPCVRCGHSSVYRIEEDERHGNQLVCVSCKSLLKLEIENVASA